MKVTEKNYVRERIREVVNKKCEEVTQNLAQTSPPTKDILKAIEEGKVKLKKHEARNYIFYLKKVFDISPLLGPDNDKLIEKTLDKIKESGDKVIDEIMIGDSEKALWLLRNFQETDFLKK